VGIELLFHFTKSRVFTVLPTASQMNWSQMELTSEGQSTKDGADGEGSDQNGALAAERMADTAAHG
jgi:hypothetical protein